MDIPETIENEFGDIFSITGYDEERMAFTVNSQVATHYRIDTEQFCNFTNLGVLMAANFRAKEPEIYKKWLKDKATNACLIRYRIDSTSAEETYIFHTVLTDELDIERAFIAMMRQVRPGSDIFVISIE